MNSQMSDTKQFFIFYEKMEVEATAAFLFFSVSKLDYL